MSADNRDPEHHIDRDPEVYIDRRSIRLPAALVISIIRVLVQYKKVGTGGTGGLRTGAQHQFWVHAQTAKVGQTRPKKKT